MSKYIELARNQFYTMKEEWLDDDRHCIGGRNEQTYKVEGVNIKIKVDGNWDRSEWFDYIVIDKDGLEIETGTDYCF